MLTVYRPDSERRSRDRARSRPRHASLAGLRIAVLDNGKPNAARGDDARRRDAGRRAPARRVALVTKKGPRGRSANAAIPCAPDIFERVLAEADVVITGTADCGSCTAYSVHDTIELEKAGQPDAWCVTTTQFAPIAATMAARLRPARGRAPWCSSTRSAASTPRPWRPGRTPAAGNGGGAAHQRAGGAAVAPLPTVACRFERALAELRELVGADGADLVVVEHSAGTGRLSLRLVIPDAHCAECVLPRDALESTAVAPARPARGDARDDRRSAGGGVMAEGRFEHLDEIDHLLTTTKAVRKRLDLTRPVNHALVRECIEIGCYTPNASNAQEWRWVVVDDPALRAGSRRSTAR